MPERLLAIHAHPDDESSKGAATVSRCVSKGADAMLVTATGGEAGDILNPAMGRPEIVENLTQVRRGELEEAARIIGYGSVTLLGYRDSGMPDTQDNARPEAFCNQDPETVLERLVGIVRAFKPHVVLGYDSHEFYPHPDHLFVHRLSVDLFVAAADPERFPDAGEPWQVVKLLAPVFTIERIRALHEAMLDRTGESPFSGWLERLGEAEEFERQMMRVDVTGFIEQGRDALRAHRTQVDPNGFWFAVPTEVVEEFYPWEDFEVLASVVEVDSDEADIFDGIE